MSTTAKNGERADTPRMRVMGLGHREGFQKQKHLHLPKPKGVQTFLKRTGLKQEEKWSPPESEKAQPKEDQICHLKRHEVVALIAGFVGDGHIVPHGLITMSLQPGETPP